MKFEQEPITREVLYFGFKVQISILTRYIATDENGEVWAFRYEPYTTNHHLNGTGIWHVPAGDDTEIRLGKFDSLSLDWTKSMAKVPAA